MIVRELLTRLGFQVNDSQMRKYEGTTNRIKESAQGAADAFRGMFAAFIGFGALKSLATTADNMQSLEHRIGSLTQNVGTAADGFDFVAQKANAARQSIDAYGEFFVKAGKATQGYLKTQAEVAEVTDGVAFALAATGQTAAKQSEAFFQLGQAIGSPVIQMEEMNTVIDVAPDLFRALGEAIPGAEGNLKAFVATGKVTGEMLARGLMKVLPQFRDEILSMPMTIGVAGVLMTNRWKEFVNRMNRESSAVTGIANFFLATFDIIEKGIYKLVDVLGGAQNAVKTFGIVLAAALAPLVFKGFVGAIALLLSPIGALIGVLTVVGFAMEDFYQWMNGAPSVFGRFFGSFEQYRPGFVAAWETIKEAVGAAGEFLTGVFRLVQAEFKTSMNGGLMSDIMRFVDAAIPYLKIFADFVVNWIPWATIIQGFKDLFGGIIQTISGFLNMAAGLLKILFGALTLDGKLFTEGFKQLFSGLGQTIIGVCKSIGAAIRLIFSGIGGVFGKQIDSMVEKANKVKKFLGFDTPAGPAIQPAARPNAGAGMPVVPPMVNPARMAPGKVAGAAAAPGGVPVAGSNASVTINQTLPPGTPQETKRAAKDGTNQAMKGVSLDAVTRRLAQTQ